MDVTLVLTHRCNLACTYCYAGDHHAAEMDDGTLDRGLDLLFSDGAELAQLSFFGGEPFLSFAAMKRAVSGARARAGGRPVILQCTTNGAALTEEHVRFVAETGMRVTVSIDGVKEAHDLGRPRAGGQSSFGLVARGLRRLLEAGARPEAMMVITPATAPWLLQSVTWLWDLGVTRVRANLSLRDDWDDHRAELQRQLVAVGRELLSRRLDLRRRVLDEPAAVACDLPVVEFEPFSRALAGSSAACAPARRQVVVGTRGNLYPCAPMVGEDRDGGPEAALRIGHISDGGPAIAARCDAGCSVGGACACAAYLETGDPRTGGENGLWYARVCREVGAAVAEGLATGAARQIVVAAPAPPRRPRRSAVIGTLIGMGGLALAGTPLVALRLSKSSSECSRPAGMVGPPEPPPEVTPPVATPPVAKPPVTKPPVVEPQVRGDISPPPEPPPPGGLAPPPPPNR